MSPSRLIIDDPAPGAWNMAVDEALLESAAAGGPATLRFYQWAEPTLSLGYFQAYRDRSGHRPSTDLSCVRRSSGGGALVHHHELTYSLTLPPGAYAERETRSLYCAAHKAVIAAIDELGSETARLSLCEPAAESPAVEPFLCFQRRADGDLLVEGPFPSEVTAEPVHGRYKVCGSAQRKRRGALMQHGGVLLAQSERAPELPGLSELGIKELTADELTNILAEQMLQKLGLRGRAGALTVREKSLAGELAATKHSASEWVERR